MVSGLEEKLGVKLPDLTSPEAKDFLGELVCLLPAAAPQISLTWAPCAGMPVCMRASDHVISSMRGMM